jgi:predicted O-methyltransferase YrrM
VGRQSKSRSPSSAARTDGQRLLTIRLRRAVAQLFRRVEKPGLLNSAPPGNWHVEFITNLARLLRPVLYVELGIYQAELLNKVAPLAGTAIGVDLDPTCGDYVRAAPNVRFFGGSTDAFAKEAALLGLRIDMLFIDADHCRESVVQDFTNYLPLVRPHGLILLHDTHPGDESLLAPGYCCDAYRAIEELQSRAIGYEMMTMPLTPGLTICRKRTAQLAWME